MIRAFVGKPGGGKSYLGLKDIVDELRYGVRYVATNVPLLLPALREYFEKYHPKEDIDLHERVFLLNEEQCQRFWLHRRPGISVPDTTEEEKRRKIFPKLSEYPGVLFVIDEGHKFFDARWYQNEGEGLTHYNSQHRKLQDEVVYITQFPELLSKRVRGFVAEWHDCRNLAVEKMWSVFRKPSRFVVCQTFGEPGKETQAANWATYSLDKRLAACYDTMAGVGIPGRRPPEGKRIKGAISVYWLILPVAGFLYFLLNADTWAAKGVGAMARFGENSVNAAAVAAVAPKSPVSPAASVAPETAGRVARSNPVTTASANAPQSPPPPPLTVQSVIVFRGELRAQLSDGRYLYSNRGEISRYDPTGVVDGNGKFIPMRAIYRGRAPDPAKPRHREEVAEIVIAGDSGAAAGEALKKENTPRQVEGKAAARAVRRSPDAQ